MPWLKPLYLQHVPTWVALYDELRRWSEDVRRGFEAVSTVTEYRYWNTATSGDPGTGGMRADNSNPVAVVSLEISTVRLLGSDLRALFRILQAGDRVYIQVEGDPSVWFRYDLTGGGTENVASWTFPVAPIAGGGTPFPSQHTPMSLLIR